MTVTPMPHREVRSGPPLGEPLLPESRIEEIRTLANRRHDDNPGISKSEVARAIIVSAPVYTQFLLDKYTGDNTGVARKVERYWSLFDRRRATGGAFVHVETSVARRVENAILKAEATRKISLVETDSGVGASDALLAWSETKGVPLLHCSGVINNLWPMLVALSEVVVDGARRLRPADAIHSIVESLRGTNRTLLVDEAHYLTNAKCIDQLRRISDLAGVGLVMVGNASRYEGRGGGVGGELLRLTGYKQFQRRVVCSVRIKASSITRNDLRMVLGQALGKDVLEDVLDALLAEAHENGGIGRCETILQLARLMAGRRDVAAKHIFKVIANRDEAEEE